MYFIKITWFVPYIFSKAHSVLLMPSGRSVHKITDCVSVSDTCTGFTFSLPLHRGMWLEIALSKSAHFLKPYLPWADLSLILCSCLSRFDGSLSNLAGERCQFSQPVSMPVRDFAAALFSTEQNLFDLSLYHLLPHNLIRGIISQTQVIIT